MEHKHIIPAPRHAAWRKETVSAHDYALRPEDFNVAGREMLELFRTVFPSPTAKQAAQVTLETALPEEGYALDIQPAGIAIRAKTARGLYYAYQTLNQIRDGNRLPCGTVADEPALALRGFQLSPHGMRQMTAADIRRLIRTAGKFKLNTILIKYNDRFPYQRHPAIVSSNAFTLAEIAEFAALARQNQIELIPLVQSLSHLGFVLRHAPYDRLREGNRPEPLRREQLCPAKPESLALNIELADEVRAAHPGGRYFHLGGDEARNLGECPACAAAAAREGPEGVYLRFIERMCAWARQQGRTPVLWDDMLCRYPAIIDRLDRSTVIMYWDYWTTSVKSPIVVARASGKGVVYDRRWNDRWAAERSELDKTVMAHFARPLDLEGDLTPEYLRMFRPYLGSDFPKYMTGFPYLRFFQDQGFQVVGAPTTLGNRMDDTFGLPNYARFLGNIRAFTESCIAASSRGILTTAWYDFPPEILDLGLMATAQYAWSGVS